MNIEQNFELQAFNTFGLSSHAKWFSQLHNQDDLMAVCQSELFAQQPHLWLGGGSNIIMRPEIDAWVLQLCNKGIAVVDEDEHTVRIEAQAGEVWHDFVTHCLALGYSGLENLSLIPGQVGAAPVQNIGAYGVEVQDIVHTVICFDIYTRRWHTFSKSECQFAYRDSVFKHLEYGRFVIWSVIFELNKQFKPKLQYGNLDGVSKSLANGRELSAQIVGEAVCHIRQQKLPDPKQLGNVGSFFHNPIVNPEQAQALQTQFPKMPQYVQPDGRVKIAAGWLIEQAGLKGLVYHQAAVHVHQALVLVNVGRATYQDVSALSQLIQQRISAQFGINLQAEPSFW